MIEVRSTALNAARTALIIDLNLTPPIGTEADVHFVQLSYIIVGSDMKGFHDSDGIASSYIFVRNSQMETMPNDGSGSLFDFKNGALKGPYNYDPAEDEGCGGMVDPDGNWRVEDSVCAMAGLEIFITGFYIRPTAD